jgi:hypothetical protein
MLLAAVAVGDNSLQAGAVGSRHFDGDPLAHAGSMTRPPRGEYLMSASDH